MSAINSRWLVQTGGSTMHVDKVRRNFVACVVCAMATLALGGTPAVAHQRQLLQIGASDYLIVIGFLAEPVYTGDRTGLDLRVMLPDRSNPLDARASDVKPVENLDKALKVEIKAGPHARVFDLKPTYGAPGRYEAIFYPTVATTYSFRLFGTINDVPVDLSFACNPLGHVSVEEDASVKLSEQVTRKALIGSFGCPAPRTDAEFPPAPR
jgi:hypothetical protein